MVKEGQFTMFVHSSYYSWGCLSTRKQPSWKNYKVQVIASCCLNPQRYFCSFALLKVKKIKAEHLHSKSWPSTITDESNKTLAWLLNKR